MDKFLCYSLIAYKVNKVFYNFASFILGVIPIIVGLYKMERILPFPLKFPLIDTQSSPGFEIHYLFTCYIMFLNSNGLLASETILIMFVLLGMGHIRVIMEMINELDVILQNKTLELDETLEFKIEQKIRDIILEHQKQWKSAHLSEKVFSNHAMGMVLSASSMVLVCMLLLVQDFWLLGLVLICIGLLQILFICMMGTVFQSSCEQLSEKLYMFEWYLLTPRLRKHWVPVMQMAQRPPLTTIGGIQPSNLNTFMLVSYR